MSGANASQTKLDYEARLDRFMAENLTVIAAAGRSELQGELRQGWVSEGYFGHFWLLVGFFEGRQGWEVVHTCWQGAGLGSNVAYMGLLTWVHETA